MVFAQALHATSDEAEVLRLVETCEQVNVSDAVVRDTWGAYVSELDAGVGREAGQADVQSSVRS